MKFFIFLLWFVFYWFATPFVGWVLAFILSGVVALLLVCILAAVVEGLKALSAVEFHLPRGLVQGWHWLQDNI